VSRLIFGETAPIPRSGYQARHQGLLDQGLHPMTGKPLRAEGGTCGACAHLRRLKYAKTYTKCELSHSLTHGPATDCRTRWPACELFEARP
jgi:hypothetical protein